LVNALDPCISEGAIDDFLAICFSPVSRVPVILFHRRGGPQGKIIFYDWRKQKG
jgi:hypothetical protein